MEENVSNVAMDNVENTGVVTTSSDDNMVTMLLKLVFVVLIGGLVTKLVKRFINWVREGQRLRKEEKDRKDQKAFDELVDKKAQEKLDELLAKQVESESKENTSEEKK